VPLPPWRGTRQEKASRRVRLAKAVGYGQAPVRSSSLPDRPKSFFLLR